jgi:hypothetical protein
MTSRNHRPAFADDQCSKPHDIPLLGGSTNHEGFDGWDDDLERPDRESAEGHSSWSSFELTNPLPEQDLSQPRSWTAVIRKYISTLNRLIPAWRNKSRASARARSRSLRGSLYFIAVALMILSVSLLPSYHVCLVFACTNDFITEVSCNSFHFPFLP